MFAQERQRRIKEALAKRAFPPVVLLPEQLPYENYQLSLLFTRPIVVWVPECRQHDNRPLCVHENCDCTPKTCEYKHRLVEGIEGKYDLLYVKYRCTGETGGVFSTISNQYLQRDVVVRLHFPFVLRNKTGFSKELLTLVHEAITTTHNKEIADDDALIQNSITVINQRRHRRYYKLYALFADGVRKNQLVNPNYLTPIPPSIEQFCEENKLTNNQTLISAWLDMTELYDALSEQIMKHTVAKQELRIHHISPFCNCERTGRNNRVMARDPSTLLLVENELGQVVGCRVVVTHEDDSDEAIEQVLQSIEARERAVNDKQSRVLISDDVNAVRNAVHKVFGDNVEPWQMHPAVQHEGFVLVLKERVPVNVSLRVGVRLLHMAIVQHNLKIGAQAGRNPDFIQTDLMVFCEATAIGYSTLPECPQMKFINSILSYELQQLLCPSTTLANAGVKPSMKPLDLISQSGELVGYGPKARQIRTTRTEFFDALQLTEEEQDGETGKVFSIDERELLCRIQIEQYASDRVWKTCTIATTILYNLLVHRNSNDQLQLRRRSYVNLLSEIQTLTREDLERVSTQINNCNESGHYLNLFSFRDNQDLPGNVQSAADEVPFQTQLFGILRQEKTLTQRKKLFRCVYDFASCICDGIYTKSEEILNKKWESLKRSTNRGSNLQNRLLLFTHSAPRQPPVVVDPTPPTQAQAYGATPNPLPVTTAPSPIASMQTTPSMPDVNAPNTDQPTEEIILPPFQIADDHFQYLLSMLTSIASVKGKWRYIHSEFRKLYPTSTMTVNALRCRLNGKKRKRVEASPSPPPPPVAVVYQPLRSSEALDCLPKRSRAKSCVSCQRKKKRCGDVKVNPTCERVTTRPFTGMYA